MNIAQCLATAVRAQEITQAEADDLNRLYQSFQRSRALESPVDADQLAKRDLTETLARTAARNRRNALLKAAAKLRVDENLGAYRSARGHSDPGEGAIALLEHYGTAPYSSVVGRSKAIVGRAHAMMADMLAEFERTAVTGKTPNVARLDNIVRERFGESSGDPAAKALADVFGRTAEWLRAKFNRAGGDIGKLEKWGLPQHHSALALVNAGRQNWKWAIKPLLAPEKMIDQATGRAVLDEDLDGILDAVYDLIVTNGWAGREPSMSPSGRGATANRRADHRFLVFKDADSWLAYQRDFGEGNPFAAMMAHINGMARDIAALETLGPNPQGMIEYLKQSVIRDGEMNGSRRSRDRASRKVRTLDAMWKGYTGTTETPVSTLGANIVATGVNLLVASKLGSAIASSLPTDPIYQTIARKMAGIPAAGTLFNIAKSFTPAEKQKAIRQGLILDSAQHTFSTQARYAGTLTGPAWSRWLADRTLTWSGLTSYTQAGRHSFGMSVTGHIADQADRSFDNLDPAFGRLFQRYGMGNADWDKIRSVTPAEPVPGATFISPAEIAAVDENLAERVLEMILMETQYAVPSGTLRGRAAFVGTDQPGTFWGAIKRSAAMFKSFPTTFAYLYGSRFWYSYARSKAAGAAYAGALLTTTTLGGMLAIWLKDVVAGRDPRPIYDEEGSPLKFMGSAFLQGGGFGLFGDFLFADINRFGGGFGETLAGPLVGTATDLWNLTAGNIIQLAAGDDTNFSREMLRFIGQNTPVLSTLWYLRAGYQRVVIDQLEAATDPEAHRAFRREQNWYRNTYGNEMWWPPGQTSPDRGPQFRMTAQ